MSARQRIGFIGLGSMGSGMAARLVEQGYELTVYNRTRAKSEALAALGAVAADSPAAAAAGADVLFLSLADQDAVTRVLFGADGALAALPPGAIVADMSTVAPAFARELAGRIAASGRRALDTCVLGNAQHARDGELRIMAGGAECDFEEIRGVLEALAKEVTHLGPNGLGATMKLTLNLLMGIEMQALAEAVVFGERAGLRRKQVLEMIAASGFSSPVMRFKAGVIGRRAFTQADFRLSLMRKDLMLALAESQRLGVPMPATESAYEVLTAAGHQGLGDLDCASVVAFQEKTSGLGDYPWPDVPATG
jgi:3-hydroxyisobutyrate dehydrogenase